MAKDVMTDSMGRPYIPWEMIGSFMVDAFKAYGCSDGERPPWHREPWLQPF